MFRTGLAGIHHAMQVRGLLPTAVFDLIPEWISTIVVLKFLYLDDVRVYSVSLARSLFIAIFKSDPTVYPCG